VAEQEALLERKQKEVDATVERGKEAAWRYQYVADMLVAPAAWETNDLGRLRELLGKYEPRPGREDLRGFEWFYLWRLAPGEPRTLAGRGRGGQMRGRVPRRQTHRRGERGQERVPVGRGDRGGQGEAAGRHPVRQRGGVQPRRNDPGGGQRARDGQAVGRRDSGAAVAGVLGAGA